MGAVPRGLRLREQDIWITVFGGDDELGLGPDEDAIEAWLAVGVPRERIVECPRSENFWQVGPTGPCGPCSELYLDRGVEHGKPDDLPGGENERFLEYWNLVFMQLDQNPVNVLTPLPAKNIDTGLGLNRMASILQDKPSVFETDQFAPLISLGEELSGRRYGQDFDTDRALRILADHARAMTFLIADGVVPSNEDRGYVLRRIMRRAIREGRALGLDPGFLIALRRDRHRADGRPSTRRFTSTRDSVRKWLESEEESFGRTLEQGSRLLDELIVRAKESGEEGISGEDAFRLHDTYGFPIDLTLEIVAEHELGVDEEGFEALMNEQRERAPGERRREIAATEALRERAVAFAGAAGFDTDFVGYETTERETTVGAIESDNGRLLVKLVESPFYATGGGQVADSGYVECADGDCLARVDDVLRLGDDQVVALVPERGTLEPGERVHAHVDRATRHATECNHTATHLLHAALRQLLGTHVHQAGSYVGPDKLRFDFTHGSALSARGAARDRGSGQRVDPREPARPRADDDARRGQAARRDGAVRREVRRRRADGRGRRRVVLARAVRRNPRPLDRRDRAVQAHRRELERRQRRRIEALTGPAAVELMRRHDALLHDRGGVAAGPPGGASQKRSTSSADASASSSAPRARALPATARSTSTRSLGRGRARRRPRPRRRRRRRRRQGAARDRRPAEGEARRRRDRPRQRRRRAAST